MQWRLTSLSLLMIFPRALATGWDDFADDLATDLAPLISLFGERLSNQFLSESTSVLDNFLFSMAPLGILTAVVSVIRVCGNSSLRAFIGRAQEGPGDVENELLSCVSEMTAEMFNDGGISRVLGRPRILEVVVWEDTDPHTQERTFRIGTLRDALQEGSWVAGKGSWILDEKEYIPELDIPNLSLNKGIEKRSQGWFFAAAAFGLGLQVGILVYAAITVYLYPQRFKKDGDLVVGYAFPLFFLGSIMLCLGMFLCAFIIERSSTLCYLRPATPSKIYWLQPGEQEVGDQVFGAFLGVNEGPGSKATDNLMYIKSVRSPESPGKAPLLLFTVTVTMIGFVVQFVGIRGLHASVILAETGATLLMAVIRTCLRTKRTGPEENRLAKNERHLVSHHQQELDCFAFHLLGVKSFQLVLDASHGSQAQFTGASSVASTRPSSQALGLGTRLMQTRAQLARLTSNPDKESSLSWDDLPIRQVARNLADTIESTMNTLSSEKDTFGDTASFDLMFTCQSSDTALIPTPETCTIKLERSEDTLQWKVDETELEAVLGLWTWSLLKSDPKWLQGGLGRAVGLTESEAAKEETDLYFHKWIFRQREAKMIPSRMIPFDNQLFGYYSDTQSNEKEILVVKTENTLETMAAQDIYIQFLKNTLRDFQAIGEDADIRPGSQNGFIAYSKRVDELVAIFESGGLGSREDALLCIVPVLKSRQLLPELAADSSRVRVQIERHISNGNWTEGFSIAQWLCERSDGEEFERSLYELGYLCQRSMFQNEATIRDKGLDMLCSLLKSDIRSKFFAPLKNLRSVGWMSSQRQQEWWDRFSRQLGWITWHISNNKVDRHPMKAKLELLGTFEDLGMQIDVYGDEQGPRNCAKETMLGWLARGIDIEFDRQVPGEEDRICLGWALQNKQTALCHWLLVKWAEVGQTYEALTHKAFVFAAECHADSAIQILMRHGGDINSQEPAGYTPFFETVMSQDLDAAERLLANGADVNLGTKFTKTAPLAVSASRGDEKLTLLLLKYGADINQEDELGFSILHSAATHNQLQMTRLLLEKGADIESLATDGRTPLVYAAGENHIQMVELLLEYGANINAQDESGYTLLMMTVNHYASNDILCLLLDKKADLYLKDNRGMTAFDHAREKNRSEVLIMFEAAEGKR